MGFLLTVHPHGRGEYYGDRKRRGLVNGSPPRAWGIPIRIK